MPLFGGIELPDCPAPENIRRLDVLPVPFLGQMMRYGMRIDIDHFRALEHRMGARMAELRHEIVNEIPPESLDKFLEVSGGFGDGDELEDSGTTEAGELHSEEPTAFNVESGTQVARLLYDCLGLQHKGVQVKKTKGGDRLNTGKKTLEQLKREHPVVPLILEYRENSKLLGTYARSMPRRARLHPRGPDCPLCRRHHYTDEWRVHTQILSTRTATGRTASKNPNLANIPARSKLGGEIRAGFVASEGCVMVQRDFSQIELRLMADQSGDPRMIKVYAEDGDIHVETAMGLFEITDPSKIDKLLHRAPSKNVNFAIGYLITGAGLLDLMAVTFATAGVPMPDYITEAWCDALIAKWFGVYAGVREMIDWLTGLVRRYAMTWTPTGRVRRIPEVRSYHPWIQEAGVRQACNHRIQGYSADIMKLAMAEVDAQLDVLRAEYSVPSWPLMTIYDELLIEAPEDDGYVVEAVLGDVMDNVLVDKQTGRSHCRVPILSDGKLLTRWTKE